MVKDDFVTENGDLYYFDATGNQPNFVFVSDKASHWYYMRYFKATKGFSALFGFDAEFLDRSQSDYKTSVHNLNGQQYYFDTKTGIMVTNRYVSDDQGIGITLAKMVERFTVFKQWTVTFITSMIVANKSKVTFFTTITIFTISIRIMEIQ